MATCSNCECKFRKKDGEYNRYSLEKLVVSSGLPAREHLSELTRTTCTVVKRSGQFLCPNRWTTLNEVVKIKDSEKRLVHQTKAQTPKTTPQDADRRNDVVHNLSDSDEPRQPDHSKNNTECISESGLKYVKKIQDELTKNHRIDKESTSGVMPETPGSEMCPVVSFEKYISKLNPDCDRLWQKPKDSFLTGDAIWFCNVPVGEKKLNGFMSTLSTLSGLSKSYTNHSIRATGATLLSKNMFGPAQFMAVTGHRSVQSLTVYQRVDDHEKVQMGQVLSENLVPTETIQVVPYSGPVTSTTSMTSNVPLQEISNQLAGINPDELFNDFEMPSKQLQPARNNASLTPVFHNCSVTWINNLTINK